MDSVDKLRTLPRNGTNGFGAVVTASEEIIEAIADEIEREIAERYMELPVDADGVPIRVGEEMTCHGDVFTVCAVAPVKIHRWVTVKLGEPQTTYSYDPTECAHYKPRTLEDVLTDFVLAVREDADLTNGVARNVDKYAAEIRELLEVGE